MLRAGAGDDGTIVEHHRLVLDRSDDAVRQSLRHRPASSSIPRYDAHPPPLAGVRPNLVEEHQRPAGGPEEYRVPGGEAGAVRLQTGRYLHRRAADALLQG